MQLTKGANLALPATRTVSVTCAWTPRPGYEADLSTLLLVDGRVRGDADFVFSNQPASADRRVVHAGWRAGAGVTDRIAALGRPDDAREALRVGSRASSVRHRALPERARLAQGDPAAAHRDLEGIRADDPDHPGLADALAQLR